MEKMLYCVPPVNVFFLTALIFTLVASSTSHFLTAAISLLAEVSHDEAKMRERRESLSPFSHFCLVVRDLC